MFVKDLLRHNGLSCLLHVQAFLCIALLIGDGFYNFLKVILVTLKSIHEKSQRGRLNRGKMNKVLRIS